MATITTGNVPKAIYGAAPPKPKRKHKGSKTARKASRKGKGKAHGSERG